MTRLDGLRWELDVTLVTIQGNKGHNRGKVVKIL